MKARGYKIFSTTADMGLTAYGDTLEDMFSGAGEGVLHLMCDTAQVKVKKNFPFISPRMILNR